MTELLPHHTIALPSIHKILIKMNDTSKAATDAKTILFDVGGKIFRVSCSLIDEWPESMLARLVSDTGHDDDSMEKPIFIDRNGDTFQVVLDFMRYGCIALPRNLPRRIFVREMDYYGIHVNDDEIVSPNLALEELDRLRKSLAVAELNHDMFLLAVHAYHKFIIRRMHYVIINNDDEIGLKRKPSDCCKHSMTASTVLSSNLDTWAKRIVYSLSRDQGFVFDAFLIGGGRECHTCQLPRC